MSFTLCCFKLYVFFNSLFFYVIAICFVFFSFEFSDMFFAYLPYFFFTFVVGRQGGSARGRKAPSPPHGSGCLRKPSIHIQKFLSNSEKQVNALHFFDDPHIFTSCPSSSLYHLITSYVCFSFVRLAHFSIPGTLQQTHIFI